MKRNLAATVSIGIFSFTVLIACDRLWHQGDSENQSDNSENQTPEEQNPAPKLNLDAYAQLYLIDAFETDDPALFQNNSLALTAENTADDDSEDSTPSAELLERMVDFLFQVADEDDSKDLSELEFLTFKITDLELPLDAVKRIQEWRKDTYQSADVDDDNKLGLGEAESMLKNVGKYVWRLRQNRGDFEKYSQLYWDAVLLKYDDNNNGKIDKAERREMLDDARKEASDARKQIAKECNDGSQINAAVCTAYSAMEAYCQRGDLSTLAEKICEEIFGTNTATSTSTSTSTSTNTSTSSSTETSTSTSTGTNTGTN